MTLIPAHRADLYASGLSDETIGRAGLYSAPARAVAELLGFAPGSGGLVFPYPSLNGDGPYHRVKLDRVAPDAKGKTKRYRAPKGQPNRLYIPALLDRAVPHDVALPLWVTEGEKKGLAGAQAGLACVAVSGVGCWRTKDPEEPLRTRPIADLDYFAWTGRIVYLCFDSDRATNTKVQRAELALAAELRRRGARVFVVPLPSGPNGAKQGLDDFLVRHSVEALCAIEPLGCVDPDRAAAEADPVASPPYTFAPAFPPDHLVSTVIAYIGSRTDAAHEYAEVSALILLASVTPGVRADLGPYPNGLSTAFYTLMLGDSTRSRKSTVKDHARDLQTRVLPTSVLPDHFSPEAFIEQLAQRSGAAHVWFVDEFGELLEKMHHAKHLAGLRGLLLTVYAGDDYRYTRHSKRDRAGNRQTDEDVIIAPHLSVLGCATPSLFDRLTDGDLLSGLLPRFAIVWPEGRPPRRPFYEAGPEIEAQRTRLVAWLRQLHEWAITRRRPVRFESAALETLDRFAADVEQESEDTDEGTKVLLHRLTPMAVKVAMLAAAGQPGVPTRDDLFVTLADAEAALVVVARWKASAVAFASRLGASEFERTVERCLRFLQRRGRLPRQWIARGAHVSKRMLDDVQATLVDRGQIRVVDVPATSGPVKVVWEMVR